MLDVIVLALVITVSIMLASFATFMIVVQPKVMKWYMNRVSKVTENLIEEVLGDFEKGEL